MSCAPSARSGWARSGSLEIIPAPPRPYYCFGIGGVERNPASYMPAGADYCALAPSLMAARGTGLSSYEPFIEGHTTSLGVEIPVYRGGKTPTTATARERAFVGWIGELLVPDVVLRRALEGHPHVAVKFQFNSHVAHVAFTSGVAPGHPQSAEVDLANGWTVQTFGAAVSGGVFSNWNALALLLGGCLLSVLFGMLVLLLATGRTRALSLVREDTRTLPPGSP